MAKFEMDYIDVASRIVEFREKHPEGSLQQHAMDFREVNGGWWVIYTAAAYRAPDDERPGIGTAWEPIPGRTNFTRDSEVQNAETAAWGRAIVAALAADTKRGIASAEEVRNRHADPAEQKLNEAKSKVKETWETHEPESPFDLEVVAKHFAEWSGGEILAEATSERLWEYAEFLGKQREDGQA